MKTLLRVISALMLVLGVILLISGVMYIGLILEMGVPALLTDFLVGAVVLVIILNGIVEILGGILGFRAAGRQGGSIAAVVFGVFALGAGVFVAIFTDLSPASLCACILPVLYLICTIICLKSSDDCS